MTSATLEEDVGSSESTLRYMLGSRAKEGKLRIRLPEFNGRGSINLYKDTKEIPEGLGVLITDLSSGNQYTVYGVSYGGAFSQEGSQTHYSNFELTRLSPNFEPRTIQRGHYGIRLNVPQDFCQAKLTVSHSTDWDGSGEIDRISGERGKTTLIGEADSFMQSIIDYLKNSELKLRGF